MRAADQCSARFPSARPSLAPGTLLSNTLTPSALPDISAQLFAAEHLEIRPWPDELLDTLGHDPRSLYVERFWLGILGPSTTWLLRPRGLPLLRSPPQLHSPPALPARPSAL